MADLQVQQQCLSVSGTVDFATVTKDVKQAKALLNKQTFVTVDLSQVSACDSACLAFMLELIRCVGKQLQFKQLPDFLQRLISLSELESVFNVA